MSGTSHDGPIDDNSIARALSGLSSQYRRLVIAFFITTEEETVSVTELAEYVSAEQDDDGTPSLREIKIQLHHRTLPKLAATGVLDYDTRSKTVRYRGDSTLEEIQEYLSTRDV